MKFFRNNRKLIASLIIIVFVVFTLAEVYSTHNISKLAYVVALGIDVGSNNNLLLSVQISKPSSQSNPESSFSSQSSGNIINSVECSSIESGLNLFNSYISRRINLSHCKVIVFSEEIAYQGISDYIYTLLDSVEVSSQANLIVSKCSAKNFLESSNPMLESLSSRYYEITPASSEYTGYTQNVSLLNFFSDGIDTFIQPVAILGSINSGNLNSHVSLYEDSYDAISIDENASLSINRDSSYTAGETPIDTEETIENVGLAVFKSDKIVGELDGLETICHLIVSNKLKSCHLYIPNPIGDSEYLDVTIRLNHKTKSNVYFVNGSPYITCNIDLKFKILSATEDSACGNSNYFKEENVPLIEEALNKYINKTIYEYLYKVAYEYKTDIDGFGKYALKYFTTTQDWESYKWLDNYQNSTFNVNVKSTLKSGYTFL